MKTFPTGDTYLGQPIAVSAYPLISMATGKFGINGLPVPARDCMPVIVVWAESVTHIGPAVLFSAN